MTRQRVTAVSGPHEVPHMRCVSENDPKRGSSELFVVLDFCFSDLDVHCTTSNQPILKGRLSRHCLSPHSHGVHTVMVKYKIVRPIRARFSPCLHRIPVRRTCILIYPPFFQPLVHFASASLLFTSGTHASSAIRKTCIMNQSFIYPPINQTNNWTIHFCAQVCSSWLPRLPPVLCTLERYDVVWCSVV